VNVLHIIITQSSHNPHIINNLQEINKT